MSGDKRLGVAIIGCGNIGGRRANAVADTPDSRLVTCVDVSEDRARALASLYDTDYSTEWHEAVNRPDVDIVIISTSNHLHAPVGRAAARNRKHVLCEKPLARSPNEAEAMLVAAREYGVKLKTGFNLRYHNTVMKARELLDQDRIGRILFIRGWTGRGGWEEASGQTWFVDPELSGGGTLMDNGQTLFDLARMLMGSQYVEITGYKATNMWPIEPVEDNGYALLKTADNRIAELHSSWTQWKGYLNVQIFGTNGYIVIDYDNSQTLLGTRTGPWTPIQEEVFDFSTVQDNSWTLEWQDFVGTIQEVRQTRGSGEDGWRAVVMAYAVYESSESGTAVRLP